MVAEASTLPWDPTPLFGSNLLTTAQNITWSPTIAFVSPPLYLNGNGVPAPASYVGAYFSTPYGVVDDMAVYTWPGGNAQGEPLDTIQIGSSTSSWSNVYVDYSAAGDIGGLIFQSTNGGAPGPFCLGDLTVTPVPEPSSVLPLAGGIIRNGGLCAEAQEAIRANDGGRCSEE